MECQLAVVLCLAVGLLVCQVHASSEEVKEERRSRPYSDGNVGRTSSEDLRKPGDGNLKLPIDQKAEEKKEIKYDKEEKLKVSLESPGAKLKIRFPDDAKQVKEDEESIRTKKSATMRHMNVNGSPHTTTVCIQVRSDHQPQVMCGPQVGEDKEQKTPGSARFAYQHPSSNHYDPSQPPTYMRSPQLDPSQGRSSGPNVQQIVVPPNNPLMPQKFIQNGPNPYSPYPAGAMGPQRYPMMRSDDAESNSIKPTEGTPSPTPQQATAPGQPPTRIVPNPVVVHKQYFQYPQGYQQGYYSNVISPMRFNCALQPEAAQILSPYQLLRSSTPEGSGYYRVGEQMVMMQENTSPRMAQGSQDIDEQAYFMDGQARQAQQDQTIGSMYAPGYGYSAANQWESNAYLGDDGKAYLLDETQARAASEDQMMKQQMWEQNQYMRAMASSSSSSENSMSIAAMKTKNQDQERELAQAKKRLQELQQKLKDIEQRAAVGDAKKDTSSDHPQQDIPKESPEPEIEAAATEPETPKQPETPEKAAAKRQAKRRRTIN